MHSKLSLSIPLGIVALSLSALPALAHHGWAGNSDEEFELTGTVERAVSLAGPHATMQVRAADGKVWDITLAPPPRTANAGLKEDTIPVGAKVTLQGHRNRDLNKYEMKTERVIYEGHLYNVYPDRK
jgi:hypothetical protein